MGLNVSQFTERPGNVAGLFKLTFYGVLAVALVALAGIVCYTVFCREESIGFGVLVLAIWALVAVCALCWLGYCCIQLLGIYSEGYKRFSETELTLYKAERLVRDKHREAVQMDPEIISKSKEIELFRLEKELRSLK